MMKPWYKSKTVWINVLTLLALILSTIMQWPDLQAQATYIAYALTIVNLILRFITTTKLE
jgi:hypothetical protein